MKILQWGYQSPASENYIRSLKGNTIKLPLTRLNPSIFIGSLEEAKNVEILKSNDIQCVINLTRHNLNLTSSTDIECQNQYLSLKSFCSLMQTLPQCLEAIEKAIDRNLKLAIVCRDGFTKTMTAISAYYVLKYNTDYTEVRDQLKALVPDIAPYFNPEYEQHLRKISNMIQNRTKKSPSLRRCSSKQSKSN